VPHFFDTPSFPLESRGFQSLRRLRIEVSLVAEIVMKEGNCEVRASKSYVWHAGTQSFLR
jgi:hypothetical protein